MSSHEPKVLAIAGAHNSGKTTLIGKLLPQLQAWGLKVAVIKHDGHDFEPDVPGTDSYRLRKAGAESVAVFSSKRYMLYEAVPLTEQELIPLLHSRGYDLILLEGFKSSCWPKIEVLRKEISSAPISREPLAIVGDLPGADFHLEEIAAIARWILTNIVSDQAQPGIVDNGPHHLPPSAQK